ncbi:hypothetical protein STA3757_19380 [Stanieria sp. NIES-3757]|nr:hypothetical protein STA3757_19380 [Stanieria sp. NIES-3757]
MLNNRCLAIFTLVFALLIPNKLVNSQSTINTNNSCPADIKTLTSLLLRDLPNYANRVIQTTQNLNQAAGIETYIITAGKAEYEPLNLPQLQYDPITSDSPEQVFFTVLERQYSNNQRLERQTFHWLFLTPSDEGWYMVTMYSRFGSSGQNNLPTPPQESSNGIIGQAVNRWLRDCRGGSIS